MKKKHVNFDFLKLKKKGKKKYKKKHSCILNIMIHLLIKIYYELWQFVSHLQFDN